MQSDDLEELLRQARDKNSIRGITGALVYAEGLFLQILEGEFATVQALMADIKKDPRHELVKVLRESETPAATFGSWRMAYVSATAEQVARWAGIDVVTGKAASTIDHSEELRRTAQFATDILALIEPAEPGMPAAAKAPAES